jgi:hypothetical protein
MKICIRLRKPNQRKLESRIKTRNALERKFLRITRPLRHPQTPSARPSPPQPHNLLLHNTTPIILPFPFSSQTYPGAATNPLLSIIQRATKRIRKEHPNSISPYRTVVERFLETSGPGCVFPFSDEGRIGQRFWMRGQGYMQAYFEWAISCFTMAFHATKRSMRISDVFKSCGAVRPRRNSLRYVINMQIYTTL